MFNDAMIPRRLSRRLVGALLATVIACAVVWAHSAQGIDHMGVDHAVAVCLAVTGTGVAALAALAVVPASWPAGRAAIDDAPHDDRAAPPDPWARARDGPSLLQVFRL